MADAFKVLGQLDPPAGVQTLLYTVPAATSTTVSSLVVCNRNSYAIKFRVSIEVGGAVDDPKQFLYYDTPLGANDTFVATIGATLATTDDVDVMSDRGGVSFNLFGVEVT